MLNSKKFVRELQLRHESAWMNPNVGSADAALAALPLTRTDVDDAEAVSYTHLDVYKRQGV